MSGTCGRAAISRWRGARASVGAALLLACAPTPQPGAGPRVPEPVTLPPRPLAEVFLLEAAGVAPEDTTVAMRPGSDGPQVIVLRRPAPDFGLFARIELGDSAGAGANGAAATVSLTPRPGEYGLEVAIQGDLGAGGAILFSYGSHFVAPAGARERYGSDIFFERALAIGKLESGGQVRFLPTTRPGTDMLHAPLAGPGRYLVAAPR